MMAGRNGPIYAAPDVMEADIYMPMGAAVPAGRRSRGLRRHESFQDDWRWVGCGWGLRLHVRLG